MKLDMKIFSQVETWELPQEKIPDTRASSQHKCKLLRQREVLKTRENSKIAKFKYEGKISTREVVLNRCKREYSQYKGKVFNKRRSSLHKGKF